MRPHLVKSERFIPKAWGQQPRGEKARTAAKPWIWKVPCKPQVLNFKLGRCSQMVNCTNKTGPSLHENKGAGQYNRRNQEIQSVRRDCDLSWRATVQRQNKAEWKFYGQLVLPFSFPTINIISFLQFDIWFYSLGVFNFLWDISCIYYSSRSDPVKYTDHQSFLLTPLTWVATALSTFTP